MALSNTNVGPNPQIPYAVAESFIPDQLIAGVAPRVTETITVTGSAALARGTVLGKITLGAASSAAKSGGNTGTGTFVLDATTPILANAQPGIYTLRCIEAVTNGGKFQLLAPDGDSCGTWIIVAGAGGTVTVSNHIKGVLTDAGTDFVVGDGFDITIAAGSGYYKKSATAALDGSQNPVAILADYADASGGDVVSGAYLSGEFNQNALTFGTGWTAATAKPVLRAVGIFLKDSSLATDPS